MRGGRGRRGKLTARDRLWLAVVERTGCRSVAEAKAQITEAEFLDVLPDRWGDRGPAPAPARARFRGKDLHDMLKALAGVPSGGA